VVHCRVYIYGRPQFLCTSLHFSLLSLRQPTSLFPHHVLHIHWSKLDIWTALKIGAGEPEFPVALPNGRAEQSTRLSWSDRSSTMLISTSTLRSPTHIQQPEEGIPSRCWCDAAAHAPAKFHTVSAPRQGQRRDCEL